MRSLNLFQKECLQRFHDYNVTILEVEKLNDPPTFCKQDSWNFLEEDLTTHIGGASPVEVALAFKFATVSRNIQQVV